MPGMSGLPGYVTGALIAGGFAIIGGGLTALNTRATLRVNQQESREQRLWEKKTALYEDLYTASHQLDEDLKRIMHLEGPPTDNHDDVRRLQALMDELLPRTTLYAANNVVAALADLRALLLILDRGLTDMETWLDGGSRRPDQAAKDRQRWSQFVARAQGSSVRLLNELRRYLQQQRELSPSEERRRFLRFIVTHP